MLKKLTKKQVHLLLNFLDTIASLDLSPQYSVIWELRQRTMLDMQWNITRDDPHTVFSVTIRDELGSAYKVVIDIIEGSK